VKDPKEVLLAELIFSTEDVRQLIAKRLDQCDEEFVGFLEKKIEATTDLEERQAFRSLIDVVDKVKKAVERRLVSHLMIMFLTGYGG
jgi:hypothetical protein